MIFLNHINGLHPAADYLLIALFAIYLIVAIVHSAREKQFEIKLMLLFAYYAGFILYAGASILLCMWLSDYLKQ